MPTITFNKADLDSLVGKTLNENDLKELLDKAKAELDSSFSTEITIKYNDTNQPYLWSVEGLARLFRTLLGKKIHPINIKPSGHIVTYDKKLKKIRPYIACFVATGKKIDEYLLSQIIQTQEKLAENYGKKREKISIGVYPLKNISFPVHCKAAMPSETFTPLDMHNPITLRQTLEKHQKGKDYGHLIKDSSVYPVFVDNNKNILSLIPVINSEHTGKVKPGDDAIFFDTTGTDEDSVNLVANIFAYALSDRGFTIHQTAIKYPEKKVLTPTLKAKTFKLNESDAEKILGSKLNTAQITTCLTKMGYAYKKNSATLPCYRNDVMHAVDIIEDIAIAHGYDNFEPLPLTSYTPGSSLPIQHTIDTHRTLWIGQGYQEVLSAILSSTQLMNDMMNVPEKDVIVISNPVSQNYSCVRHWILPIMLDFLAKNKHVDYPQKIFEEGLISTTKGDERHLSAVTSHSQASYTELKQALEGVLSNAKVHYEFKENDAPYFIPGRGAKIMSHGKEIGIIGELHPAILEKFGISMPTVGCEINITKL